MVARLTKSTSISSALDYHTHLETQDEQLKGVDRPGKFQGEGANYLNIKNQAATRDKFKALLEGKHPLFDEQIVKVATNAKNERIPGWDFTFSPDKTVSVAWASATNNIAQGIEKAQIDASQRAMQYVEQNFAITRSGQAGKIKEPVAGLVWSRHNHFLSRALDPQLHTHNFIFNVALKQNGQWAALHSRPLYQTQQQAQHIYHAELANRLERMGFKLERAGENNFKISGIPQEVVNANSNRRQQILEATKNYSHKSPGNFERAALMTRQSKVQTNMPELLEIWNKRHAALGFGPESVQKLIQPTNAVGMSNVGKTLSKALNTEHGIKHTFGAIQKKVLPLQPGALANIAMANRVGKLIGAVAEQVNTRILQAVAPSKFIRKAMTAARSSQHLGVDQGGKTPTTKKAQEKAQEQVAERAQDQARER